MPNLVLLDIALPDGNGLDIARMIKAAPRSAKVVMVTLYDTPVYRAAAFAAGTDGFLGKSDLGEHLQTVLSDLFPQICPPPADAHAPEGTLRIGTDEKVRRVPFGGEATPQRDTPQAAHAQGEKRRREN
jgi:DNA-binding NarL/FixJ family response regulator